MEPVFSELSPGLPVSPKVLLATKVLRSDRLLLSAFTMLLYCDVESKNKLQHLIYIKHRKRSNIIQCETHIKIILISMVLGFYKATDFIKRLFRIKKKQHKNISNIKIHGCCINRNRKYGCCINQLGSVQVFLSHIEQMKI